MKNVKKIKWMILALAGLALAGSVMTVEAADVNSQGEKGNGVRRISTTPWQGEEPLKLTDTWDKTFPKSDKVDHSKVTFHNRYGITLAADLYRPKTEKEKWRPWLWPVLSVPSRNRRQVSMPRSWRKWDF